MKNIIKVIIIVILFFLSQQCSQDLKDNLPKPVFDQLKTTWIFEDGSLVNYEDIDTTNEDYYWIAEAINEDSVVVNVFTSRENFIDWLENTSYYQEYLELEHDINECYNYAINHNIDSVYEATNEIPQYYLNFIDSIRSTIQTYSVNSFFQLYDNRDGTGENRLCWYNPCPSLGSFCNKASSITGFTTMTIFCDYKWFGGKKAIMLPGLWEKWYLGGIGMDNKIDSYWN